MTREEMEALPRSRAEAKAAGAKHYFTRKPCLKGHVSHRNANSKNCVQCSTESSSVLRSERPSYFANSYERYGRKSYLKNPGKKAEYCKAWSSANPEKRKASSRKRNATIGEFRFQNRTVEQEQAIIDASKTAGVSPFMELPKTPERAKELGEIHYFTGKPCKNGHIGPRFVSSYGCVTCGTEKQKSTAKTTRVAPPRGRIANLIVTSEHERRMAEWRAKQEVVE